MDGSINRLYYSNDKSVYADNITVLVPMSSHTSKAPMFSIIIPVYNAAEYLRRCIDSILVQTYRNYEVLLVNDGSTDETSEVCDGIASIDPRIRVYHQKNTGQATARNSAIYRANGTYLIFMDADDWWSGNRILETAASFLEQGFELILWNYAFYYGAERPSKIGPILSGLKSEYKNGKDFLKDALKQHPDFAWYPWQFVFKADVWKKTGCFFPKRRISEDAAILYKIIMASGMTKTIDSVIYIYNRENTNSSCRLQKYQNLHDALAVSISETTYIEKNVEDNVLKRALLNNFAINYSPVLIRSSALPKEDRIKLWNELKENIYILEYAYSPKHKLIKRILKVIGFRNTACLLRIRSIIRNIRR